MSGAALLDEPTILVVDDEATQRLLTRNHPHSEYGARLTSAAGQIRTKTWKTRAMDSRKILSINGNSVF